MSLLDRLEYALISGLFGCALGALCWWLYGMAHSLNYDGPGMDPALRHWLTGAGGSFAVLGAVLGAKAADVVGDVLNAIFHFEYNDTPGHGARAVVMLVMTALMIAALWFTAPT